MKVLIYNYTEQNRADFQRYMDSAAGKESRKVFPEVQVVGVQGPLQDIPFDFIVAPGNSFGIMSGGFDKGIVDAFGDDLEVQVRRRIQLDHYGELNVGDAVTARMTMGRWLIYAPTMRVPTKLPEGSDVPYLAARAAIRQAKLLTGGDDDFTIAFPHLGTGTGGMASETVIRQIHIAAGMSITGRPKHQFIDNLQIGRLVDEAIRCR